MKLISIIIATFNAEKTIRRCLTSIEKQKGDEIQLIIIDGKSNDNTISIINEFKCVDKVVSEPDNGIYDAWNKGLKLASGSWIVFLGADDVLLDNCIKTQLYFLDNKKTSGLDIISAKAHIVNEKGKYLKTMGEAYNWNIFRRRMNISHGSTLHNKMLFDEVGIFDINFRICGDYELLLRKKLQAAFIDDYLINMQYGGLSTTLDARYEAFLARAKNNSMPRILNNILFVREYVGYLFRFFFFDN